MAQRFAIALAAALLSPGALALDAAQNARYHRLIDELRCLVCQNQSIAESNAPLAEDLRKQVETQIAQGRTDTEIKDYLTQRYGDFVLYRPPVKGKTLLLWGGPALLLLVGAATAALFVRRARRAPRPAAPADAAAVQRLLDDEP